MRYLSIFSGPLFASTCSADGFISFVSLSKTLFFPAQNIFSNRIGRNYLISQPVRCLRACDRLRDKVQAMSATLFRGGP